MLYYLAWANPSSYPQSTGDRCGLDRMLVGYPTTYQCLSPLMLWVRISIRARCTTLCDKVCQWLVTGRWFSPGTPVSSTNKIDHHDIADILLKVALNSINKPANNWLQTVFDMCAFLVGFKNYEWKIKRKIPICLNSCKLQSRKRFFLFVCLFDGV